jgi:putative protease
MTTATPDTAAAGPPRILAPAGSRASFLAALAAGADAVYCGLKSFSARMEAKNFTLPELAVLTRLAHDRGVGVYIALNAMLTTRDLDAAARLVEGLVTSVRPDALIIQDLGLIPLARKAGFAGEIHLSTLANVSFPAALSWVRERLGVDQVVLPRELDIDEMRTLAAACPPGLGLEVFIHGALCYGVSGRCYWSSFLGGKSGLRGRCVQPCRRIYRQHSDRRRLFACMDLSLDVLVKVLRTIPQIRTWKIEGRKKGPHYVYYTVSAYRMLRDEGHDPQAKKSALGLLEQALGRPSTHYRFLPQRPQSPLQSSVQTGSGLMVGAAKGAAQQPFIVPRLALLPGDVLRVGYEDDEAHSIQRIRHPVPARGRLTLKPSGRQPIRKGMPVFLTDRREPALQKMLADLESAAAAIPPPSEPSGQGAWSPPRPSRPGREPARVLTVHRIPGRRQRGEAVGLWVSPAALARTPKPRQASVWWWLTPVLWPTGQEALTAMIDRLVRNGGRRFVLNAPWQRGLFARAKGLDLWAGPFCNLANPLALQALKQAGFTGAFVSPEMGRDDFRTLPRLSPLPLGMVTTGLWPLCLARVHAEDLRLDQVFQSPRGEHSWVSRRNHNFWVYPNWRLDLSRVQPELARAGYRWFVHFEEPVPPGIRIKPRPGVWNYKHDLK